MDPSNSSIDLDTESEPPSTASKLEDLPPRLLGRILTYIPITDHASLKEVSPGWEKLIDEHIGVPAFIGKESDFKVDRLEFNSPEILGQIGISILHLINIHKMILPDLKFPNLVKHITFVDYISEKNFLRILGQLTNLRSLSLDMSTIHYLEFQDISLDFLSRLDRLNLHAGEYCSEWNEDVHPSKNEAQITLENFYALLTCNHFRCIKRVQIGFPYVNPASENIVFTTAIFKFAIIHHATLRHLEVFLDGKLDGAKETVAETLAKTLDIDYDALESVQLSDLFVNLHEYQQKLNILDPWLKLLNIQKSLKRCIVIPRGGDEEECAELPLPADLLSNASAVTNLTVFKWYLSEAQHGGQGLTIDCELFQHCSTLADLNLTASGSNPSKLINVPRLPTSLQRLCIEGIFCRGDDIEALASEFPSLKKLSLTSIGESDHYGMKIPTLRGIYERKKLKSLLVLEGFNKHSVRGTSQQEESSFSFLIMLLKTKFYDGDSYFHIKLCENGEYAIIQ